MWRIKMIFVVCFITLIVVNLKAQEQVLFHENNNGDEIIFIQQMVTTIENISQYQNLIAKPIWNANVSQVIQIGNNNNSVVVQKGDLNYTGILQFGDFNESDIEIYGNRNIALIGQLGSFNTFERTVRGDNSDFKLLQIGNGHKFRIEGDLPPGTKITQQGNGVNIQIK